MFSGLKVHVFLRRGLKYDIHPSSLTPPFWNGGGLGGIFILFFIMLALAGCITPPTPLQKASIDGDLKTVHALLDGGANVNEKHNWSEAVVGVDSTALHAAAYYGRTDIVRTLIDKGANVNARGRLNFTPLHLASMKGHAAVVRILLDSGADLGVGAWKAQTPLKFAEKSGHTTVVRLLKEAEEERYFTEKKPGSPVFKKVPISVPAAPSPAVSIDVTPTPVDFGSYHALVIGNNDYQHLPKLGTAINDAQAVGNLLQNKYGFNVHIITDATRAYILTAINSYRRKLSPHDNLLIYYAGHGWLDKDADQGYWLPVDATRETQVKWVSNSAITSEIRAIQAKHVMVVADSCYSGKLSRGLHITNRTPDYLTRMSRKKARVVLSSGGLEPVMDSGGKGNHSVFASAFIETLSENKGVLDGTTLFTKIREQVGWNADQIPEYANIHKAGHDGGDFLFVKQKMNKEK